jgi:hypothetical protein
MDGRIQLPVIEFLQTRFKASYVEAACAGAYISSKECAMPAARCLKMTIIAGPEGLLSPLFSSFTNVQTGSKQLP